MTFSLRLRLFEAILRKHVGWFDSKDRAPGVLTNLLIEDIAAVNGLTTESIGIICEAVLGLIASCAICFVFSWQLAIVVTLISPFMVLGGLGMTKLSINADAVESAYKEANALLSDLVMNYRTVMTLGDKNVELILWRYQELLVIPHQSGVKRAHIQGLFFAYSQCIRFIFIAFCFYVAALLLEANPKLSSDDLYTGCYVVFVGAIGSGVSMSQMPSISKAKKSAKNVFSVIEDPSEIDPHQKGHNLITHGRIQFRDIYFRYPSRRRFVLRKFNLTIEPNTSVAIVGHSGSGKSTVAGLLLRFYDCNMRGGRVAIDGRDIRDYSVSHLRKQIAIVQQEPLLFNESIKQNLLFGEPAANDTSIRSVAQ